VDHNGEHGSPFLRARGVWHLEQKLPYPWAFSGKNASKCSSILDFLLGAKGFSAALVV
jgi:hypothetical protein